MIIKKHVYRLWRSSFCIGALMAAASSTFGSGTVTTLTQQNLEAALAGGGTVLFAVSGTLPLTNTITISQNTVMDANGYNVTISGGNAVRLFIVATNVSFRVNGLTLANGRVTGTNGVDGIYSSTAPPIPGTSGESVFGGGIWNQGGMLVLMDCTLTNHFAIGGNSGAVVQTLPEIHGGDGFGGCIYSIGGSVSLTNCTLAGNSALGGIGQVAHITPPGLYSGDGGGAVGGAVYLQGTGWFQNVSFFNNQAAGGGAVKYSEPGNGGAALGGAVFATNSIVVIQDSGAVSNNAAGGGVISPARSFDSHRSSGPGMGGTLFFSENCSAIVQRLSARGDSAVGGRGDYFHVGGPGKGGVIYNAGVLQVSDSAFSQSLTIGGGDSNYAGNGWGGAICSIGDLRITGCTFDHCSATGGEGAHAGTVSYRGAQGAGGAIWSFGVLTMTNSTCTTNLAKGGYGAGALQAGSGGDGSGGAVAITNCIAYLLNVTLAGDLADRGYGETAPPGPRRGGEIYTTNSTVTCQNSIFAKSILGGDVWGPLIDLGYNICSDGTANFSATGSLNNTDPLLGPLGNYGGFTQTLPLLIGSPALNVIPAGYPPLDQRGVSRPQGPAADIGAYESGSGFVLSPVLVAAKAGPNISIAFTAQGGLSYRLLLSTNLQTWSSIATNSRGTTGPLEFTQPTYEAPPGFYRVVTP